MKTLYLAHNFLTRKKIRQWELKIEGRYNISLDNPFYDNPDRAEEMNILDSLKDGSKEQQEYLSSRSAHSIVEDDLNKIRKSDGICTVITSASIGTSMEIIWAARVLRIPVYVITKNYLYHPWIIEHATKIFENKRKFEEYIKKKFGVKK